MKKFFGMVITCMMALGLVSCSAADDDLTGDTTNTCQHRYNEVKLLTAQLFTDNRC